LGAVLKLILIIANVGTAVVPYVVFRRYSEGLALGYVAARLVEATFIGIGIISMLTFLYHAAGRHRWSRSRRGLRGSL
jgi:hypothetical protein